jgi:putative peptidoglycan lipid II flippase
VGHRSFKGFSLLALLAATDIALGFFVQAQVLVSVGVGASTDAFYAGQAPMVVLLAIFQLPLQRAVVGTFGEPRFAQAFPALRLYAMVLGLFLIAVIAASMAGPFGLQLLYHGLSPEAVEVATSVLRVQGLAVTLLAGNLVLMSLNHVRGRFLNCEVVLVFAGVLSAIWVFLAVGRMGVVAAAYGQLLKAAVCGGVFLWMLRRELDWGVPPWRHLWSVVRPLSTAGALSKLAPLVDRSIASAAASGSLTVLVFVQLMYTAGISVVERAFVAPRLPDLKRMVDQDPSTRTALGLGLVGMGLALVLTLVAVAMQLEFVAREVTPEAGLLFNALIPILVGLPVGTLAAQWLAAGLVFGGRASVTARIMVLCFVASIPVKILGFHFGGIRGLAIAMSCYYLASAISLFVVTKQRSGPDGGAAK